MMLPARTRSPPNFLMPWYFGLLSRPLREEPTPFLCAIWILSSAELDVVDHDFGEALPVTPLARVVLPALVLEDDDLLAASVSNDLAGHLGALQQRHAGAHVVAVRTEQHLVELHVRALVADERRDAVFLPRLDTELLAAGFDDSVGHLQGLL